MIEIGGVRRLARTGRADMDRMIIALDIDDTITRRPEFFSHLSRSLVAAGHRVLIITYKQDRDSAEADLRSWGIAYDLLITSTLESCLEHGVEQWKAAVCREHGVDVFFEDDPDVLRHVDDSVACLVPV